MGSSSQRGKKALFCERGHANTESSESAVHKRYLEEILRLIVTMTAEIMSSKICSLMALNEEEG
jgi:hypothetical protein